MRCSCVLPKRACREAAIPTVFVTLDTKSLKESTDRTHDIVFIKPLSSTQTPEALPPPPPWEKRTFVVKAERGSSLKAKSQRGEVAQHVRVRFQVPTTPIHLSRLRENFSA